jgi:hypothetical protein
MGSDPAALEHHAGIAGAVNLGQRLCRDAAATVNVNILTLYPTQQA